MAASLDNKLVVAISSRALFNFEEENAICRKISERVRGQLPPELVFEQPIPRTPATVEAFAAGQPVVIRSPDDPASAAYFALADALARRNP